MDGCLVDFNDSHARAWSLALARFGHRVEVGRIRREIGKGGQEMIRDFVGSAERHFLGEAMGEAQTEVFLDRFGVAVSAAAGRIRWAATASPATSAKRC